MAYPLIDKLRKNESSIQIIYLRFVSPRRKRATGGDGKETAADAPTPTSDNDSKIGVSGAPGVSPSPNEQPKEGYFEPLVIADWLI